MGTPVARQFYRLYPKKTSALIAVDGALRPASTKKADIDRLVSRYEGADYKEKIGVAVDHMFAKDASAELKQKVKERMQSAPQHVVVSAMKGMYDPAIWKEDDIKVPLQAIMAINPARNAIDEMYASKRWPQVEFRVMKGVGHFLMMEKPKEFNELLAKFLQKQNMLNP
jgi:pimeloyl-ACP methyl ester carboxylesterase